MTWGYDTMVTRGYASADKGNIFAHAKDLLYALDRARDVANSRLGIIFVAHSLGGIIVKEVELTLIVSRSSLYDNFERSFVDPRLLLKMT